MPHVDSTAILRIEYDEFTRQLDVTFTSGHTYTYYGVPRPIYERFIHAPSKGQFFNEHIRDHYRFA